MATTNLSVAPDWSYAVSKRTSDPARASRFLPAATLLISVLVVVAGVYIFYVQPRARAQNEELSSYGQVTDLTYQATTISMVFTSDTSISLYSASISYTANNHAVSEQSYQTPQMPLGPQPFYNLTKGDTLTIAFSNVPAGSLLLNIDVQVNASLGAHQMLLSYEIPQLETNSSK